VSPQRRSDARHLDDAREHLRILDEHLSRGTLDDALIRDAVSHGLEGAIDAVGKVSPDLLRAEAPDDWPTIAGMRNLLAHPYAALDQEILQNTIDNRLPNFVQLIDRLHEAVGE
jgi:uncharacterized protein with HEPN domain